MRMTNHWTNLYWICFGKTMQTQWLIIILSIYGKHRGWMRHMMNRGAPIFCSFLRWTMAISLWRILAQGLPWQDMTQQALMNSWGNSGDVKEPVHVCDWCCQKLRSPGNFWAELFWDPAQLACPTTSLVEPKLVSHPTVCVRAVFESPLEVDLIDTIVMHVLVVTFATLRWWCKDDTKGRLCPWVGVVVGSCFTTGIPYVTCAYLEFAASPLPSSSFTARGVLLHSIVTCITCIYTSLPTTVAWLK